MDLRTSLCDETLHIYCSGELTTQTGRSLAETVKSACPESGLHTLVLDFTGVTYMDSSGLGKLITIVKEMRSKKIEVCIDNPIQVIKTILASTRIDTVVQLRETVNG